MARKVSFRREQEMRGAKSENKARLRGAQTAAQSKKWALEKKKRVERAKTFSAGMRVVTVFGDEGIVLGLGENGDVKVRVGNKTRAFNADILTLAPDRPPSA